MGFPVYPTGRYFDRLSAILVATFPGTPNEAKICLYNNDVTPDANSTPDSFTPATFEGSDPIDLVANSPTYNDQGIVVANTGMQEWTAPEDAPIETIYGVYLLDHTGTKLLAAQRFDTPQVMGGPFATSIKGVWRTSEPLSSYGWIDVEA